MIKNKWNFLIYLPYLTQAPPDQDDKKPVTRQEASAKSRYMIMEDLL